MGASQSYSTIVSIQHEIREGGVHVLKSKNLPGLLLAGSDLDRLYREVPASIAGLFKLNYGMEVKVLPAFSARAITAKRKIPHLPTKYTAIPACA